MLSDIHPVGRAKALFLKNLGYDNTNAELLANDLLKIAREQVVLDVRASEYGTKYIIDGMVQTPNGSTVAMRTVWIVETNDSQPRFVTAYPT